MEAFTDRIKDSQARLLEQSLAFVKHTRGASDQLMSRTVGAGGAFVDEARGASGNFVSQTREAGVDLVAIVQNEVEAWVAYLKSQELLQLPELPESLAAPELPAKLSTADIERQILEAVRQALAAVEGQVEQLEGRIDGRIKSLGKPASLPKPKKAKASKPKASKAKAAVAVKAPFRGYDELTAKDVAARVARVNDEKAKTVLAYEKSTKNRATVIRAAKQRLAAN